MQHNKDVLSDDAPEMHALARLTELVSAALVLGNEFANSR